MAHQPYFILNNQWKDFFVGYRVLIPYNQELLLILHQLRYILAKKGEGRIGHHDIRLLQQFDALGAAEISVSYQETDTDLLGIGHTVAVVVTRIFKLDGLLPVVAAEEFGILVLVACGDEPFKTQLLEAVCKIVEEVAYAGIIAVAEDGLAPEVLAVVTELVLNVAQLRVELVLLGLVGGL